MNKPVRWIAIGVVLVQALLAVPASAAFMTINAAQDAASYSPATRLLAVTGDIVAVEDLDSNLVGRTFSLALHLDSVEVVDDVVVARFDGVPGDDFAIGGLLAGETSGTTLFGPLGFDFGQLLGDFALTGPLAGALGGSGALIALQFNMSAPFSADLFDRVFTAAFDGRLTGTDVPVGPLGAPLALVLAALASFARRQSNSTH